MRFHTVLLAGLVGTVAVGAEAQVGALAIPVKDAPFTATWTRVSKYPGGNRHEMVQVGPNKVASVLTADQSDDVRREKIEVARSSDGSLYEKTIFDGNIISIVIYDVPHGRVIRASGNNIVITNSPQLVRSVPEEHATLESSQRVSDENDDSISTHTTPLGEKAEKGMTLFGSKSSSTKSCEGKGKNLDSEEEAWVSDTGLTTLLIHTDSSNRSVTAKLVKFRAGEPDAKLFQIPKQTVSELNGYSNPYDNVPGPSGPR